MKEFKIVDENGNNVFNQTYTEAAANRIWDAYNGYYEDENGGRYIYIEEV